MMITILILFISCVPIPGQAETSMIGFLAPQSFTEKHVSYEELLRYEPEWSKEKGKEIKIIKEGIHINPDVILDEVEYRGVRYIMKRDRPRKWWQRIAWWRKKGEGDVVPQARILNYLNIHHSELISTGFDKAEHFVLFNGKKAVLFKKFDGKTLFEHAANTKLGIFESVRIILSLAKKLKALYEACGFYHWDITSSNIYITPDGEAGLFDFDFSFINEAEFCNRSLFGVLAAGGNRLYCSRTRDIIHFYIKLTDRFTGFIKMPLDKKVAYSKKLARYKKQWRRDKLYALSDEIYSLAGALEYIIQPTELESCPDLLAVRQKAMYENYTSYDDFIRDLESVLGKHVRSQIPDAVAEAA
ncbi:MAG: hypothetical protein JW774_08410 [Candidatus Aureabacteria bacterium]|nr:hypothetical protein [Candidatus Auribacterota bacterium]